MRFFLCLFYIFHRRYSNCRPLNSSRYNRIICQRVENTSFFERLSCILHIVTRLPRLQIQFRISRSFRPRNLANLGSKIRFWIRRKEHTLNLSIAKFLTCIFHISIHCLYSPSYSGSYSIFSLNIRISGQELNSD